MSTHGKLDANALREALAAVGDLMQAEGERASIVVVGGASLSLLGLVRRTTGDVDVIARLAGEGAASKLVPPDPLPEALVDAIETVKRDFGLPPGWINTAIGPQWDLGLPPKLREGLTWQTYGGLRVGLVGRASLIALKLFAAIDHGSTESVHYQDLITLSLSDEELHEAATWVRTQDASPSFADQLDQVTRHVRRDREDHR